MGDEKEELYDVPLPKRTVALSKKTFLATLSKAYGKPVTLKDLDENDRDVLNQVVENERRRKSKYETRRASFVSVLSKRKRESGSFKHNKTMRKGPAFWEQSKRASPIHPPTSASKKPPRKGIAFMEQSKRASPIHPPTSASKKPARKEGATGRAPSSPKSARHLSRKRSRSKSVSDGLTDFFSKMAL